MKYVKFCIKFCDSSTIDKIEHDNHKKYLIIINDYSYI